MDKARTLEHALIDLDDLCSRAVQDKALRMKLAETLQSKVATWRAPTGLGNRADRFIAMIAGCSKTTRDRIWTACKKLDDERAASAAEQAIANLRQLLMTTIDVLGDRRLAVNASPRRAAG